MERKFVLQDVGKAGGEDLDKTLPPEETVHRFRARLQHVDLDILSETVRIDTGRLGIPVFFSVCGRDAAAAIGKKRQMGKGGTPAQAEASAVMELAERFSLYRFRSSPANFMEATCSDLGQDALPYERIVESVQDDPEAAEQVRPLFSSLPLRWTWALDLTQNREILVPFDWFFDINAYNGAAAGNCLEEAVLQGICEVVERHVCAEVARQRLSMPAIDPNSATDPLARELIRKYRAAGIRLHLSDFSLKMGIPTVAALAYDPGTYPERSEIVWTAGTTTHPEKSLIRALTEVAQLAGDFDTTSRYEASGLPKFEALSEARFVLESSRVDPVQQLPDVSHPNIRSEIRHVVTALDRQDMDALFLDVTDPVLGIPAVYTMVPGTSFRERAPGASVAMFLAKRIAEDTPPPAALTLLAEMARLVPDTYFVSFYQGLAYQNTGDPANALAQFERALAQDPVPQNIPTIYSYMGVCLKDLERYETALKALESALAYDAQRTDIHNLMGFCFYKLQEHQKAIDCFQKVLELDPSSAIDYANIGANYREMGDIEKAAAYFRLALDLDPDIGFAREHLARLEADSR